MITKMSKKEPKRLPDLIRGIRLCKTQDEVRKLIKQECALVRASFRSEEIQFRRRNILKLMYIHMLGYATHFAQIECLNLLNMDTFVEKRVGYLGLTILLDGNSKVLMMATNVLLGDLSNNNEYIVCLALSALSTMGNEDVMFRECVEAVGKCMMADNSHIRKKALICGLRGVQMGLTENSLQYYKACANVISKNSIDHGSLIAAIQMMTTLVKLKHSYKKKCLRDLRGDLVRHLRNLTSSAYELSHDINGVNDPFLHVYILRLLGVLSVVSGGEKTSHQADLTEKLVELLPVVATQVSNDGFTKNPQLAVQAEISQTILNAQLPNSLVTLALNTMGHWLVSNKTNPNVKYIGLKTMQKLVKNTQHIQRHRKTILECLGDQDPSIRYRALDLVKYITDDKTRQEVVNTLVVCLKAPEEAFHEKVVEEIVKALRNAPDEETISKMLTVLKEVKSVPMPEVIWHVLHRIQNTTSSLRRSTVLQIWEFLSGEKERQFVHKKPLMEVVLWCIGEYGSILEQHQKEVVELLAYTLKTCHSGHTKSIAIMALAKLWRIWPICRNDISATIELYTEDSVLELQARAVECKALLTQEYSTISEKVLEEMPSYDLENDEDIDSDEKKAIHALEEETDESPSEEEDEEEDEESSEESSSSVVIKKKKKKRKKNKEKDKSPSPPVVNVLLPGPSTTNKSTIPAQVVAQPNPTDDLLDLLGICSAPPTKPVVNNHSANVTDDLLASVLGAPPTVAPSSTLPAPRKVFDKHGVSINFSFHPVPRPSMTRIMAVASNENASSVEGFSLLVAVPKYIKMEMKPATGTVLGPHGSTSVSQRMQLDNQSHGTNALMIRIQVTMTINGQKFVEVEQVDFK